MTDHENADCRTGLVEEEDGGPIVIADRHDGVALHRAERTYEAEAVLAHRSSDQVRAVREARDCAFEGVSR